MLEAFNKDITIRRFKESSPMGTKTYHEAETIKGRLEFAQTKAINSKGQEVAAQADLFTTHKLGYNDVVLYEDRQMPILSIATLDSLFDGFSHYEIKLGG
ncbi:MAG: hypothetical protein GX786_10795 [Clostridiales bacterium]|nr:hypothetical protein [Clostridiales bacterium]